MVKGGKRNDECGVCSCSIYMSNYKNNGTNQIFKKIAFFQKIFKKRFSPTFKQNCIKITTHRLININICSFICLKYLSSRFFLKLKLILA
jgi:hypothetical protein